MQLTAVQEDALIELLNVGFGRAAASLSELIGHRVLLDVPEVAIHPVDGLPEILERRILTDVASVHQIFSGQVAGDALLILDHAGAATLEELLTNEPPLPLVIDASAREVLTEVGNILVNACFGTFGNLLQFQVSFSVPQLSLETLGGILETLRVNDEAMRDALVVQAAFRLKDTQVTGYLVIALTVASLDRLIRAVAAWQQSQH